MTFESFLHRSINLLFNSMSFLKVGEKLLFRWEYGQVGGKISVRKGSNWVLISENGIKHRGLIP